MSETVTEPVAETPEQPESETETPEEGDIPFEDPEPDTDEQPEEAPPTPEQAQQPAADPDDPRIVESVKKWTNFEKAVRSIWGEYQEHLVECPLCFPSHKGLLDLNDRGQYPEAVITGVVEFARGSQEPEYPEDPYTRECGTCGGLGKTKTRGHVPGKTSRVCPTCKGVGFQALDQAPTQQQNGEASDIQYDLPTEQPLVTDDADVWGSPRLLADGMENPNYGKMPQYKNPSLP